MDNKKKPNANFLWFYGVLLVMTLLMNGLLIPNFEKQRVTEVGYGSFIRMLEQKKVEEVKLEDNKISYITKGDKKKYVTGKLDDPELVSKLQESGAKYAQDIPSGNTMIINFFLMWVAPFIFLMLIGRFLLYGLGKRMGPGGGMMSLGKSNAKLYVKSTGVMFDDVAGQDEAKEALTEIVDFLHEPAKYTAIGAKMPKGALLVGPPGTGKTLLAKAVAGEAGVPFFSISGSEFVEMFVGMGASRVRDLFKQAKEKAPCIVFIDEIDAIGKKRDGAFGGGNDEREQTLNQLLSEMDGFENGIGIVMLAATNRPDSLDKALLRPGRFDRRIPVELPDLKGRESILKVHAKDVKKSEEIDYNQVARATSGASGAELANIVNEAALRAVRMKREGIKQEDLEESVETVIAGYQRKNAVISEEEKRIIAYHEVGHALVAAAGKHSAPVHKITIIPRTSGALGYTMQVDEVEKFLMTKDEAIDKITTYTGGRAAEEVIFNVKTSGASNDIEMATKIARAMVTRFGMDEDFGMVALETVTNQYLGGDSSLACSQDTSKKIDDSVIAIVGACHDKAINILKDNIEKLHEISEYLLKNETITGEEFMDILDNKYEITPDPKLSHDEGKENDHIDEELGKDEILVDTNESTTDKAD
ncbi:MAG: ATP-dependent zinc metalloprotease FtsH [Peptostreptococcus sp.]|uniref:ATP-dependent zinc metalloprotease FtsH n=1 Tax=Peptostreptococcus anaerobius 653-L TaxID=596329 RepID=D3MTR4_9FIRM|nr:MULTISPECIES: ATP-dependent zinc metalloprotease FtsH [Peptostreptococcus]EFD04500.1 ATP-dependent metallopeptidase HflB [Peptostreptococcus anaerobius 653-L]MDB8851403.1 ATP-dependent zinc metalloprotease FtsH [Peptostreptococcus anaerobius]MDU1175494.1 ATP-dependent zinc metalloprotease FtsH [Peptostreptococcus anaerobius]MDU1234058.1 ATP-dependent zinc metalloprotease FtsH [Peptostreptococcus anaerobius]MDU3423178.1 ATP-dependent zinc metalloprotease FtsH [Peptostreptococcus anaerobius]